MGFVVVIVLVVIIIIIAAIALIAMAASGTSTTSSDPTSKIQTIGGIVPGPFTLLDSELKISNTSNSLVLDCQGNGTADGTKIILYDSKSAGNGNNQVWTIDGSGLIKNKHSGTFLSVDGSNQVIISAISSALVQNWFQAGPYIACYVGEKLKVLTFNGLINAATLSVSDYDSVFTTAQKWTITAGN